jgi:hypothetical protein
MTALNFIQYAFPKLLVLLLIFMISFIMAFHYLLALNNLNNYLMVVEKLEENLECVAFPLVLG